MKKLAIVVCLLCLFMVSPALADFYGGVGQWDRMYYEGQGGEFIIYGYQGKPFLSNSAYADETKNIKYEGSFETFCLEAGEYISEPMGMIVNTTWIDESTGVSLGDDTGSHAVSGGMTYGDNLDPGTAYLYTQFATGQLDGYVYAYIGTETVTINGTDYDLNRSQAGGVLQRVIWALEGEGGDDFGVSYHGVSLNTGQQALATYWRNLADNCLWTTVEQVRVINMYGYDMSSDSINYNAYKQDQLYLVPVPGAVLLGILGLGAAGWKLRRKKPV